MENEIRKALGTTKTGVPLRVPSGQIWPNGDFGLGFVQDCDETDWAKETAWLGPGPSDLGAEGRPEGPLPLILSEVSNSHKRGLGGITAYGRRFVRSGCYLLESRLGREDCMMWTLTVPTLGREARVELARNWGKLTNRLVQWLSRRLAAAGRPPAIVGVVEVQTGRLSKFREGYLHLHLICPAHSNSGGRWAVDVNDFRAWWHSAIERYSGVRTERLPRIQAEIVRKSAEGYMGKYLSKGSAAELKEFIQDLGEECVPGQWWFCSALMRDRVRDGRSQGRNTGALLDAVVQHAFETGDLSVFEFIRHVDVVVDGVPYTAGWYGKLRADVRDDLLSMLRKADIIAE